MLKAASNLMLVDIVIPVAPFHLEVVQQAVQSAQAQTVPAHVIVLHDTEGRGAAYARNQGAQQGVAPFIVFLDADDVLAPTFVEECLKAWVRHGSGYVYTDWMRGNRRFKPPVTLNIFTEGLWHIVTTLLPRKAFETVGGFDEQIATLEDEDLYRRLHRVGVCPHHVELPLVEYHATQGHSAQVREQHMPQVEAFFNERDSAFKGLNMCACNDVPAGESQISGEYREGDVLAIALYTPRRMNSKVIAGRVYEKPLMGLPMWVHPSDVQARPDLWQLALTQETLSPDVESVLVMMRSA